MKIVKKTMSNKIVSSLLVNFVIFLSVLSVLLVCFNFEITSTASVETYQAIYRGNTKNKNVSLLINVYWGTEYVKDMVDILTETGAKATFFVGGCWASENVDLLNYIFENGNEIGNHGYFHKDHKTISKQRNFEEIDITHKLIKELLNIEMTLFMPPSGSFNLTTLEVAKSLNYKTLMWSKDTIDWRDKDENLIYSRATKNMQNGDLILMHPTKCTKNMLKNIILAYQNSGYSIVTASQNID